MRDCRLPVNAEPPGGGEQQRADENDAEAEGEAGCDLEVREFHDGSPFEMSC
jgi:hypothetical protein